MQFIKKNLLDLFILSFFLITPVSIIFADVGANPVGTNKITNPITGVNNIQEFILKFLEGIIKLALPVVALAVIYCGFLFVKAQGKPEEITKAKEALMYTLIGAAILLGAMAISRLVFTTVTTLAS